jgi:hypothetical protein
MPVTEWLRKPAYRLLGAFLLAYAVSNWLKTIRELRRFYTNMWIWDPWDYLSHFGSYKSFDASVLWIQHNEHREIGTELTYILDIVLFHGRQFVPEASGIAAYLSALLILVAFAWIWSRDRWSTGCAALLAAAIAGYKICVVSLNIPFLTSWPQWEFFGIAALAALVIQAKRGGKLFLIAAIFCGVAATYSMSNGMLVWPLMLVAGLVLRFHRRQMVAIGLCGVASIGLYFYHYKNLHTFSLQAAMHHPGYFLMFLGSFLGMPFSTAFHASSHIVFTSVCGWIALILVGVNAVWIARHRLFDAPAVIVLGGFCLLVLASSVLTAIGRMDPADSSIIASRAGRYVTEPTLFWCALLLLSVWLIGNSGKGYAAFAFLLVAGILSVITLHKTDRFYAGWENYFQRGQWATIGFANGVTDNTVGDTLFPSREYLAQFKHVLVDNRLAIFAGPEPGWIGRRADQVFARGADGFIHGEVSSIRRIGSDFEVQGWADGAARVVFVDESGRIVGFGMRPKAGPAELYTHDVPRALAFTGFVRGEFGARSIQLWAVDRNGRVMSRMGRLWNALSY